MIGWRDGGDGLHHGSLFAVFAALARGQAWSFPALRPHQREPWHAFTVQVAALALIRAGRTDLPPDEAGWRDLLLALTPDQPEAWELVVDDWTRPALLQPAVSSGADYKKRAETPDALDMLVTSKNHDVKQERIAEAEEEDWLFALVTLQTMEGIMGKGNYGISRMFGGYGTRMSLGIRPMRGGAAAAFVRDVNRLLEDAACRPDRKKGLPLIWLAPWSGSEAEKLTLDELDELYVEVCRRVRLTRGPKGIEAILASSESARIESEELGGNTRDPWMPLILDTKKDRVTNGKFVGFTPGGGGFDYRQMSRLLTREKVVRPVLAEIHDNDAFEDLSIVASALVRGQGKTEGLHRRHVRAYNFRILKETDEREVLDRVGEVARTRSDEAWEAGRRLRHSLILLVQGGPEQARLDDDAAGRKVDPWMKRFEKLVDREFFERETGLWAEVSDSDADTTPFRVKWRRRLRELAGEIFTEATAMAPHTQLRRVRAIVCAQSMLDGQMKKWLKEVDFGE